MNNHTHRRILVTAAFFLGWCSVLAHSYEFTRMVANPNGKQGRVTCVLQDHKGFLWFGTTEGLKKFDGNHMTVFKHDPEDSNSLGHNHILALHEDRNGSIWIGTDGGGLDRLDPHRRTFSHFQPQPKDDSSLSHPSVTAIAEDPEGHIWVGTDGGLNRLDRETGMFHQYKRQPGERNSLSHNRVRALLWDRHGFLWIGTAGGGLSRFEPGKEAFQHYRHSRKDQNSLPGNRVSCLFEDRRGHLWVGLDQSGLVRFNYSDGVFERFRHNARDPSSLSHNNVNAVFEDRFGRLWIGTDEGLNRFDWASGGFAVLRHDRLRSSSLSHDRVHALLVDRTGILWIGSGPGFIDKLNVSDSILHYQKDASSNNSLSHNNVSAFAEDGAGSLWVGTMGGGLNKLDRLRGEFSYYRRDSQDPESLASNRIRCLLIDRDGFLWIGTDGQGLDRLDPETNRITHYRHQGNRSGSIDSDVIWSLHQDDLGNLWVGTQAGLNRWNRDKDNFEKVELVDNPLVDSLGAIWALHEDRQNDLWIGTERGGLLRLHSQTGQVDHYQNDPLDPNSLSLNVVLSISEDRHGRLWVGTWGGGLNLYLPDSNQFKVVTRNDGLPDNVIYGILADDRGRLWVSTNRGLALFDPESEQIQTFGPEQGLDNLAFNAGAFYQNRYGELFFGGLRGFDIFRPENLSNRSTMPPVAITALRLYEDVIATDLQGRHEFEFEHHQDFFTFECAVLDFENPEVNRFAIKMEGKDKDWHYTQGLQQANYHLDPGEYVFRVRGANSDGVWNQEGVSVSLLVKHPFWMSWWFIGLEFLLGLLALVGLVLFLRHRFRQQEAKAILDLELRRKTEELEAARDLQLSMLPEQVPEVPHLDIAVHMQTATEVGGDYYDFVYEDDGTLTAVVGDATGHGLKAGTMVAATKSLFMSLAGEREPSEILVHASTTLASMGFSRMYMGMSIARFNGSTVTMSSAAMPYALHYRKAEGQVHTIELKGLPLGSHPYPYQQTEIDLAEGDVLLMATDGYEEMFNPEDELLGHKTVKKQFLELGDRDPEQIIDQLVAYGQEWSRGRPQEDDITFLVIKKRRPHAKP